MSIRVEKYSNERLRARKARILAEARNLIGSKGVEGVTMRELAEKSDVALATLYNIYGSKDLLVACAVNDFFDPIIAAGIKKSRGKSSLDRLMALLETISLHVRKSPAYVNVVIAMYFKLDRDQGIHEMLYKLAHSELTSILDQMRDEVDYNEWVSLDLLADEMSEQVMWRIFQWCRGDVPDAYLDAFMKFSLLQILVGAVRGDMAATMQAELKKCAKKVLRLRRPAQTPRARGKAS